ncbi:MAG: hypothetical protein CM1200mP10_13820 [Candidatus Neomarinimicrobiota bacterium]|nr:MAG: hypothetical protein CM1200mP10_13820 [Candidatus Neomarinimicrobiota bacterium]
MYSLNLVRGLILSKRNLLIQQLLHVLFKVWIYVRVWVVLKPKYTSTVSTESPVAPVKVISPPPGKLNG